MACVAHEAIMSVSPVIGCALGGDASHAALVGPILRRIVPFHFDCHRHLLSVNTRQFGEFGTHTPAHWGRGVRGCFVIGHQLLTSPRVPSDRWAAIPVPGRQPYSTYHGCYISLKSVCIK